MGDGKESLGLGSYHIIESLSLVGKKTENNELIDDDLICNRKESVNVLRKEMAKLNYWKEIFQWFGKSREAFNILINPLLSSLFKVS